MLQVFHMKIVAELRTFSLTIFQAIMIKNSDVAVISTLKHTTKAPCFSKSVFKGKRNLSES